MLIEHRSDADVDGRGRAKHVVDALRAGVGLLGTIGLSASAIALSVAPPADAIIGATAAAQPASITVPAPPLRPGPIHAPFQPLT